MEILIPVAAVSIFLILYCILKVLFLLKKLPHVIFLLSGNLIDNKAETLNVVGVWGKSLLDT